MKTEIEFLEQQGHQFDKDKDLLFMEEFFSSEYKVKDICDLLRKYADQETERLKAELVKTIETAKATSVTQRQHIERLQNELNKLKEKHKSDVINAIASCLYEAGDDDLEQEFHYKKAEQYYAKTHGQ